MQIDYTHPALGNGCFGEGCLVSYGYDLVGDDYNANKGTKPNPDNDPMDCGGHGSHVAGIIAAQPNEYNFTGVAPGVTLGAYRVFGCEGTSGSDILISSFLKAYQAGSDIISASIGGPSGWVDEPWAMTISRIVARGVPCTVAAGNEGTSGIFFPSSGSSGRGVMAIASFDNTESPALFNTDQYTVDGGDKVDFSVLTAAQDKWDPVQGYELWAPSYDTNTTDDGCNPYPADTPDLSDKVVLVHRGTCTFVQKAQNAIDHGAKYILIYNSDAAIIQITFEDAPEIKAGGTITQDQGIELIKLLKAGKKVQVYMSSSEKSHKTLGSTVNTLTGGALSYFTTWGPTWEMNAKPEFGAPGGNILSTIPVAQGSYGIKSGTSMATPFVAGALALIINVRGTRDPALLRNLLSANANPQLFNDNTKFLDQLAPVPQQGGGLIQAYDAAYATTLLEPTNLSFNDTANFAKKLTIKLSNTGKEEVSYEIGQVSAMTVYSLGTSGTMVQPFPNEAVDSYAELGFSENKVTLAAGSSASIDVVATPPRGLDVKRLPVWSGYVTVNGTDGTSLSMPYQGLSGSLKDSTVLGKSDTWMSYSDDKKLVAVPENHTFILPAPGKGNVYTGHLPQLVANLSLGGKNLTAHLQPMTTCPPNSTYEYWGYKTIGQPIGFPSLYNSRGPATDAWDGQLDSGNYVAPGKYRFIVRALRIFGDPTKESDWDVSVGPRFIIKYE